MCRSFDVYYVTLKG